MEFKNRVGNKVLGLILLLCIAQVCHGQLMCYVCDNCDQVNAQTPQVECNEDFFNTGGPTASSVQTTTEHAMTTAAVTEDTGTTTVTHETTQTPTTHHTEETTMTSTTTETKLPESTTKATAENVTETTTELITEPTTLRATESTQGTTNTTEDQPPSPPTVGPPNTTTAVPTPPNTGTVKPIDDVDSLNNQTVAHEQHENKGEVEIIDIAQGAAKLYKPSAEFRVRQLRSISDVTFHCFKVQATTVNGTMVVNRGCSHIQTNESVCGQWEAQHSSEKMNKCYPCSRTKCNGSSTLNVSITALIVAAVAMFMHRK